MVLGTGDDDAFLVLAWQTAQGRLAELEGSMAEKVKQADALTAELTTLKANYDVLQQTSASQVRHDLGAEGFWFAHSLRVMFVS